MKKHKRVLDFIEEKIRSRAKDGFMFAKALDDCVEALKKEDRIKLIEPKILEGLVMGFLQYKKAHTEINMEISYLYDLKRMIEQGTKLAPESNADIVEEIFGEKGESLK